MSEAIQGNAHLQLPPTDRLLRLREVLERVGVKHTTLYRWMNDGLFPRPVRLSEQTVRWLESEVTDYIRSRPRATPVTVAPEKGAETSDGNRRGGRTRSS